MAKSEFSIRMDYKNAIKQAEKLEDTADKIKRTAKNDLDDCINRINSAWDGDSSNRFCRKGYTVVDELEVIAQELRRTAETIRKIATNTYNADMRALDIAKSRNY